MNRQKVQKKLPHPGVKAENIRRALWKEKMPNFPRRVSMYLKASEDLSPGVNSK